MLDQLNDGRGTFSESIEQQMQPLADCIRRGRTQVAGAFDELGFIDGENLGHIYNAGLGKVGLTFFEQYIAGRSGS